MVSFITQNKKKAAQVGKLFAEAGILFEHISMDYEEPEGLTIQETAKLGAKTCAEQLGKAVFVDDSGFFFDAKENYPGARTKRVFQEKGYNGILQDIDSFDHKGCHFLCALAYCEPGKEPVLFQGEMKGTLLTHLSAPEGYDPDNFYPYDRFVIPAGHTESLAWLRHKGIAVLDHRTHACHKLLDWLKNTQKV